MLLYALLTFGIVVCIAILFLLVAHLIHEQERLRYQHIEVLQEVQHTTMRTYWMLQDLFDIPRDDDDDGIPNTPEPTPSPELATV